MQQLRIQGLAAATHAEAQVRQRHKMKGKSSYVPHIHTHINTHTHTHSLARCVFTLKHEKMRTMVDTLADHSSVWAALWWRRSRV